MPSKEYLESQRRIRQYEATKQRMLYRNFIEEEIKLGHIPGEYPYNPYADPQLELPGGDTNLERIKQEVEQLKRVTISLKGKSHTHKGEVTSKEEGGYY